ncbi:uncharacterized protein LOC131432246 [Malaya genurostris]|uniref:uncharacterized protein LOC131432246 n=1 Tax=Malaya genurostris TaxID=325434 RepID=UPI0026F40729|nr:uncharacterized protein LOC131432246 [Malaya genurostris]
MSQGSNTWAANPKSEDFVQVNYKGKDYSIPRSEYNRRLTKEDCEKSGINGLETDSLKTMYSKLPHSGNNQLNNGNIAKTRPRSTDYVKNDSTAEFRKSFEKSQKSHLDQYVNEFKKSMMKSTVPSPSNIVTKEKLNESAPKEKPQIEHIYTLEDMVESKETVIELPVSKKRSLESSVSFVEFPKPESCKSSATVAVKSIESFDPKTCQEVTEKLCQLKSNVVNLIDQTINQFESEQQLGAGISLHPSGDGSKPNHRIENLKVLKTDSFAQNKSEIRMRLYGEIEMAIGRLKDFELLEVN